MVKGLAGKAKVVVIDVVDMPEDLKLRTWSSCCQRDTANADVVPDVYFYQCDLTKPSEISSTCASIKNRLGNPSVLVNNAGIGTSNSILDATPEWLEKIFRVNTICHWQLIQEFLPGMLEQRKGHIITIASMASYIAGAGLVDYAGTKAAVLALHEGEALAISDQRSILSLRRLEPGIEASRRERTHHPNHNCPPHVGTNQHHQRLGSIAHRQQRDGHATRDGLKQGRRTDP